MTGKSITHLFAEYAGDPSTAAVAAFDVEKGTIVADSTNGRSLVKTAALGTNTAGYDRHVTEAATQTLTNKTLTAPTITSPVITGATESGSVNSDIKVLAASITYDSKPAAAVVTGFSWSVVAGATYIFELELPATMTTVGGLTLSFKLTTATLTSIRYNSYAATAVDNTTAVSATGTTTTDATAVFDSKTAAYTKVRITGSMVVNAAGTFAWFATQNTSGTTGDVTILLIGGYARLTRVA